MSLENPSNTGVEPNTGLKVIDTYIEKGDSLSETYTVWVYELSEAEGKKMDNYPGFVPEFAGFSPSGRPFRNDPKRGYETTHGWTVYEDETVHEAVLIQKKAKRIALALAKLRLTEAPSREVRYKVAHRSLYQE